MPWNRAKTPGDADVPAVNDHGRDNSTPTVASTFEVTALVCDMPNYSPNELLIRDLIRTSFINPSLASDTRESVVRELVALAASTGLLVDREALLLSLLAREAEGSTASNGCALLHPRTPREGIISSSFVILGRTRRPVQFGAPDGVGVDIFFALCCQTPPAYSVALNRFAKMILKTSLLAQLRKASDAMGMYQTIVTCEEEILK